MLLNPLHLCLLTPILFLSACNTSKKVSEGTTAQVKQETSTNFFSQLCSCKNKNGETLDSYAQAAMKESGQNREEFMSGKTEWVFVEFGQDEVFLKNVKERMAKLEADGVNFFGGNTEELKEMAAEAQTEYPACLTVLPLFLQMAK